MHISRDTTLHRVCWSAVLFYTTTWGQQQKSLPGAQENCLLKSMGVHTSEERDTRHTYTNTQPPHSFIVILSYYPLLRQSVS